MMQFKLLYLKLSPLEMQLEIVINSLCSCTNFAAALLQHDLTSLVQQQLWAGSPGMGSRSPRASA